MLLTAGVFAGEASPGETEAMGCYCVGTVGNVDCDYEDRVDIADLQFLVDHMFLSFIRLPNPEEANCDGIPGSGITLTDLEALLDNLFLSQKPLPECPKVFNKAPVTQITSTPAIRYVNAGAPSDAPTGVPLSWAASDLVDFPYTDPEFEFEWRLYGPYSNAEYAQLRDSFIFQALLTHDDKVYKLGQPPTTVCDTIIVGVDTTIDCHPQPTFFFECDTSYDGGVRTITCDTILVDTLHYPNPYGTQDSIFDVDYPAFTGPGTFFNRIAARSSNGLTPWVYDLQDTIYNAFVDFPHDTTIEMNFIFLVQARDPVDSSVTDVTPPFQRLILVDPKYEHNIAIISWQLPDAIQRAYNDTAKAYWGSAVTDWAVSRGIENFDFDPDRDVFPVALYSSPTESSKFLRVLLSYKTAVMYNSCVSNYQWGEDGYLPMQSTYQAIASGVNVWAAMRAGIGAYPFGAPSATVSASAANRYYFGVQEGRHTGWAKYAVNVSEAWRIEDFLGASSMDNSQWPDLAIDPTLMHRRYDWWGPVHWHPDSLNMLNRYLIPENVGDMPIDALPEVGWCLPTYDAEVMYRYQSLYGAEHFMGSAFSYNGLPVMLRLDREYFRTVYSCFTPMALESTGAQALVNSVLDYLYYLDSENSLWPTVGYQGQTGEGE